MSKKYKAKYWLLILLSFIFYLSSLYHCTSPTKTETVTFSGTVTLVDTTDYSGVKVMLYKPVEIDTALTNLNANYPGVGIELNQKTEFYWREHKADYETVTDARGRWQIKNVEPGSYHIVAKKEGYGWRVLYDMTDKNESKIILKKALMWQGTYDEPMVVSENGFVRIVGNTTFNNNLTVNPGTIIEFKNAENDQPSEKITVHITGDVTFAGTAEQPIYLLADDSTNYDAIEISNVKQVSVSSLVSRWVYNPFYIKNTPIITITHSRFAAESIPISINTSDSALVENNFISHIKTDGLQTFDTHLNLRQNIFNECGNTGLNSKNANNSFVKYNAFKKCANYAAAMNWGGYAYKRGNLTIGKNDFVNNGNDILLGKEGITIVNNNNFYSTQRFAVWTDGANNADTINCEFNYWDNSNINEIERKIYDKNDRIGEIYEGPIVDYKNFKLKPIIWINDINTK